MADGFGIEVEELNELAADLAIAAKAVTPLAVGVQTKYGHLIVREAVRRAPEDTGALKRSIKLSDKGEAGKLGLVGVSIEADTSTETGRSYAGYVEFGTSRMAPQPFMRPALRKYAKAYRDELIDAAAVMVGTKGGARRALRGKSLFRGASSFSIGKALSRG